MRLYHIKMGRKSLAPERITQILDAFERCIRQYGFEGSSLEKIASEAGVKRSIIRHYIGNREAVVQAMVKRLIENYRQEMADGIADVPPDDFANVMLDHLFLWNAEERTGNEILLDSLWAKQESDPYISSLLTELYQALEDLFTEGLGYAYPQTSPEMCRGVAYSLICLVHTHASLVALGLGASRKTAVRQAAQQIVDELAKKPTQA